MHRPVRNPMKTVLLLGILCGFFASCAPDPYLRGLIRKEEHQYEQALSAFQEVTADHQLHRRAQVEIGELKKLIRLKAEADNAFARKRYPEARAGYEHILRLDPGNPEARDRIRFMEKSKTKEDRVQARSLSDQHLKRGKEHQQAGEMLLACAEFRNAHEVYPGNQEAADLSGEIAPSVSDEISGNVKSARELIQRRQTGDALTLLEKNINCQPEHQASLALYLETLRALAVEAYNRSDYQVAIDYFEREEKFHPDDPVVKRYLEKARKLLGELEKR